MHWNNPVKTINTKTVVSTFTKRYIHVNHDERMTPIKFEGTELEVKGQIDIFGEITLWKW